MGKPHVKWNLPAGPVFSLLLVGLLFLSAVLYYRAVNIQRFLEPALALTVPRSEFSGHILEALQKEFGADSPGGISVRSNSIIMDENLLFSADGSLRDGARSVLKKLARVFLSVLNDDHTRSDVSMILVIAPFPVPAVHERAVRDERQRRALKTLDAMFAAEPTLAESFGPVFAAAAVVGSPLSQDAVHIEFRLMPSELMHIEVLQKLQKYTR